MRGQYYKTIFDDLCKMTTYSFVPTYMFLPISTNLYVPSHKYQPICSYPFVPTYMFLPIFTNLYVPTYMYQPTCSTHICTYQYVPTNILNQNTLVGNISIDIGQICTNLTLAQIHYMQILGKYANSQFAS